jgi:hypothetical protein
VTSIGSSAFFDCSSLTSVTIPEGVTVIGYYAFYGCSGLTSVTIPEGVTEIGDNTFYYCSGLTSVTIGDGVTSIGSSAFYYCFGLTSVTIGDGVTSIGSSAFSWCFGLTSVTSMNITPPSLGGSWTFYGVDKSIPLFVPAESVEAYKSADYWNEFTNIQPLLTDNSPISDVEADNVSIRLVGNRLVVENTDDYAVYTLNGQSLGMVESLERGVYIVVADGVNQKIVVK